MRLHTSRDVGALVRDRRRAVGLTQEELASRAGVSRRWLAALEGGKPGAEIGLVLRVLAALGVELQTADRRRATAGGLDLDDLVASYDRDVR